MDYQARQRRSTPDSSSLFTMSMSVLLSKSKQTLFRAGLQGCLMQWGGTRGGVHEEATPNDNKHVAVGMCNERHSIESMAHSFIGAHRCHSMHWPHTRPVGRRGRRRCMQKTCLCGAFRVDRPLASRDAVCRESYRILEKSALGASVSAVSK